MVICEVYWYIFKCVNIHTLDSCPDIVRYRGIYTCVTLTITLAQAYRKQTWKRILVYNDAWHMTRITNRACHPGDHHSDYFLETLALNHRNSSIERSVHFIYWFPNLRLSCTNFTTWVGTIREVAAVAAGRHAIAVWTDVYLSVDPHQYIMMTSSNGNIFRVTGPLCGEFTDHRWIPLTKASDAKLWYFLWSAPEQPVERTIETQLIWDAVVLIMTSL